MDPAILVAVILGPPALFGAVVAVESWATIRRAVREAKLRHPSGPGRDDLERRRRAAQ